MLCAIGRLALQEPRRAVRDKAAKVDPKSQLSKCMPLARTPQPEGMNLHASPRPASQHCRLKKTPFLSRKGREKSTRRGAAPDGFKNAVVLEVARITQVEVLPLLWAYQEPPNDGAS